MGHSRSVKHVLAGLRLDRIVLLRFCARASVSELLPGSSNGAVYTLSVALLHR